LLAFLLFAACSGKLDGLDDEQGGDSAAGCDEYGIRYRGPDEPHVGDEWELWMTCDDHDTAVMIVRIYPGELATIDGRVLKFREAGSGKIRMQTGVHRATMDVTILP
jgi:hypothetical protein